MRGRMLLATLLAVIAATVLNGQVRIRLTSSQVTPPSPGPITVVTSDENDAGASGTTLSITLNGVQSGDAICVCGQTFGAYSTMSFADDKGNVYTEVVHTTGTMKGACAFNTASGNTTVTMTVGAADFRGLSGVALRGVETINPIDDTGQSFNPNNTTATTADLTASVDGAIVGCVQVYNVTTITETAPWELLEEDESFTNVAGSLVWRETVGVNDYAPLWTLGDVSGWNALAIGLKSDDGTVGEPPVEPPVEAGGGYRSHFVGYGAAAFGGRTGGTRICEVNTLTISGGPTWGATGDFRDCTEGIPAGCDAFTGTQEDCARFVVFGVSGASDASGVAQITVTAPYLTIAGQTAPSCDEGSAVGGQDCDDGAGGFTLTGARFLVDTHDVVVQHIRISRPPEDVNVCSIGDASDAGDNSHVYNVIFDHMSCRWATDTNNYLQAGPGSTNVMLVDSIISEGLWTGALGGVGAGIGGDTTAARNLFAHHYSRQPIWGSPSKALLINNIAYNGTDNSGAGDALPAFFGDADADSSSGLSENVLAYNLAIEGPDSGSASAILGFSKHAASITAGSRTYMIGNDGPGITGSTGDGQWTATVCGNYGGYSNAATCGTGSNMRTNTPFAWFTAFDPPIITTNIRDTVLANVGARPNDRDAADARVIDDVLDGTGTHFLDWTYVNTNYGGQPPIATRSRAVTANIPADPNGQGIREMSGGGFTTIIEDWLESDSAFGALRLEDDIPDPPATQFVLKFYEIRYHDAAIPQPVEEGVTLAEFTIDGGWEDLPRYKYVGYTYAHNHIPIDRARADAEACCLTSGEMDALFDGVSTILLSQLQEAEIAKIHAELNDDPPLAYGAQRSGTTVLYDVDGWVATDSPSADYRNGKTMTWPADYVYGEGRLYWNLTTPAVMEYLVRYTLRLQSYSPDARIFIDESGTYGDDLFARDHVANGTFQDQIDHVVGLLNDLNREIRTREDPLDRLNQGLMPNSGWRRPGHAYGAFWNAWYETLITTDSDTIDSLMVENVWPEDGWATDVAYYRDKVVALNDLGIKICFAVTNYDYMYAGTNHPSMVKLWLWLHLVGEPPNTYAFINKNTEEAMVPYEIYQMDLGAPLEDPQESGGVWTREFTNGTIVFDTSGGSIESITFVP